MADIAIVTICYNNLEQLKTTLSSVDKQTMKPLEHIIIDGSTSPDIKEFLNTNEQPPYRKWICEPDKGISDAFNKGIQNTKGEIINILNSGDYFYNDEVLEFVDRIFKEQPDIKWLHGEYIQYIGGVWLKSGKPFEKDEIHKGVKTVAHQSMFVKRELYDKHGLFDIEKRISMDYDFLIRIRDEKFAFINQPFVYFVPGGVSSHNFNTAISEVKQSYIKHKGHDWKIEFGMLRFRLYDFMYKNPIGRKIFLMKNYKNKFDVKKDEK